MAQQAGEKNRWWRAASWAGLLLGLSGCTALLVGAGAAGGYAISQDAITNHFDLPASHLYAVSRDVLDELGMLTVEDEARGLLKATVSEVRVTVTVKPVTGRSVQLKVKARNKFLFPQISTAHAVYNRVLERL